MKKQIFLILSLSFLLLFTGCSNDNTNKKVTESNNEKNTVSENTTVQSNKKISKAKDSDTIDSVESDNKKTLNNDATTNINSDKINDMENTKKQNTNSTDNKSADIDSTRVNNNPNNASKNEPENIKSYIGSWKVSNYIFAGIGIYSEDEIKPFLGKTLSFSNEAANYFEEQRVDKMSVLKNPIYKESDISAEEYLNGYKLSNNVVGLNGDMVKQITITDTNGACLLSLIQDDTRLFIHLPGVFLELEKI